jgi:hypothetical protein
MQFLSGLMFYRVRIALKPLDMALQVAVFLLEGLHLQFQALGLLPLLLVGGQSVLAKDHMESESKRQHGGCSRYDLSPAHLSAAIPPCHRQAVLFRYASFGGTGHLYEYKFQPFTRQVEN